MPNSSKTGSMPYSIHLPKGKEMAKGCKKKRDRNEEVRKGWWEKKGSIKGMGRDERGGQGRGKG